MCFFIKRDRHVSHSQRMDPIDFVGQRSNFKFTIDMYIHVLKSACEHDRDLNIVCFFIELGRHVNHDEWMNSNWIWMLQVKGEGNDGHHWQMWGARGCYALRCYIFLYFITTLPFHNPCTPVRDSSSYIFSKALCLATTYSLSFFGFFPLASNIFPSLCLTLLRVQFYSSYSFFYD